MAYQLPAPVRSLVPYAPVAGDFPIRLDANESFLPLPDALRQQLGAVVAGLDFNRYPDPRCKALCDAFARYYGLPSGDCVVAGNGSDELIGLVVGNLVPAGRPLAVVQPDFSMYRFYAQLAGVAVVAYDKAPDGLALDTAKLVAFCQETNPGLLLLSNPCNPTSLVAGREALLGLVAALPDTLVVVDEAYMDFATGSVLDVVGQYPNLLVLKTCSKALGLAAIRLGFAVGNPTLVGALLAVKSPYNVNTMTQAVGQLLFEQPAYLRQCTATLVAAREALYTALAALESPTGLVRRVVNTQANFVFMETPAAGVLCQAAATAGIALRQMGDYLRITAGSPPENQAVIALLQRLCKEDM